MESSNQITTVSFIGSGNVATALGKSFMNSGIRVVEIYSPNDSNAKSLAVKLSCNWINDLNELNTNSDLYIIAIPDKEIKPLSSRLNKVEGIVVHTSGSEPLQALKLGNKPTGVFYPLQTFTKLNEIDTSNIPICIEGSNTLTVVSLTNLAKKISRNVILLDSDQRQHLHLAAVTVNNFSNLMYHFAYDILTKKDIDFSLLHPLINETAKKVICVNPADAQTGPARRNDQSTINKHLDLLQSHPDFRDVYKLLSKQLINKYHDKL